MMKRTLPAFQSVFFVESFWVWTEIWVYEGIFGLRPDIRRFPISCSHLLSMRWRSLLLFLFDGWDKIVNGLRALHRSGFIHRDIKVDNILLTSYGECFCFFTMHIFFCHHFLPFPDYAPVSPPLSRRCLNSSFTEIQRKRYANIRNSLLRDRFVAYTCTIRI